MKAVFFASLGKGGHIQTYHNAEFDVTKSNEKKDRNAEWVESWTMAAMPGRSFATYAELTEAARELPT
jgi:hypothetical protein